MKKNIFYILCLTLALAVCAVGSVCSWFILAQRSIVVYSGDIKISVTGYYDVVGTEETPVYDTLLSETAEDNLGLSDLAPNDQIAYKFVVNNLSAYAGTLSIAFSDFCACIFDHFNEYRTECQTYYTANGAYPTSEQISETLRGNIRTEALRNTAKLTLVIEDAYYVTEGGVVNSIADNDRYVWKYATGDDFLSAIPLPANSTVTVYFCLRNKQLSYLISSYEAWMLGTQSTVSYPQQTLASRLGYVYSSLPAADQTITNNYLSLFYAEEIRAANPTEHDLLSTLQLELEYLKFTCSGD